MMNRDKFIEVLRSFNKPVTVSEWTKQLVNRYPSILNQTNKRITPVELAGIISLKVTKGEFSNILIDNCTPYRKISYSSSAMQGENMKYHAHKDVEPLLLSEKVAEDFKKLNELERYKIEELEAVALQLNRYFMLNLELSHASSLLKGKESGKHNVGNLQLLTKEHALKKRERIGKFTIEEQKAYIKRMIVVCSMVTKPFKVCLTDEVLDMLLDRLAKVY